MSLKQLCQSGRAQRYWQDVSLSISHLGFPGDWLYTQACHFSTWLSSTTVDSIWKGKVLVKEEHIFLYISNKHLTIVSFWPGLGHIAISKLIMGAKGTDCSNWPGLGYVSRLQVKGSVNHLN